MNYFNFLKYMGFAILLFSLTSCMGTDSWELPNEGTEITSDMVYDVQSLKGNASDTTIYDNKTSSDYMTSPINPACEATSDLFTSTQLSAIEEQFESALMYLSTSSTQVVSTIDAYIESGKIYISASGTVEESSSSVSTTYIGGANKDGSMIVASTYTDIQDGVIGTVRTICIGWFTENDLELYECRMTAIYDVPEYSATVKCNI